MIDRRYGSLTVLQNTNVRCRGYICWLCLCDCGNTTIVSGKNLKSGKTKSCGKCGYGRPKPRWDKEQLHELFNKNGRIVSKIAKEYSVSKSTVSYWLHKHKIVPLKTEIHNNCKNCGESIMQLSGKSGAKLYCNIECRREWEIKYYREHKKYTKTCLYCGKEYKTNTKNQKYCFDCRGLWSQGPAAEKATLVIDSGIKKCSRCGVEKSLLEFSIRKDSYDGHSGTCKKCNSEKWAERKAAGKIKRNKEKRNAREKLRRDTDPIYKLKCRMGSAIWDSLKNDHGNGKRGRHWEPLVGFTLSELRVYLESQFHDGMSWENQGAWHLDHIIPINFFTFTLPDDPEFQMCWALDNLRPMWANDNRKKHTDLP